MWLNSQTFCTFLLTFCIFLRCSSSSSIEISEGGGSTQVTGLRLKRETSERDLRELNVAVNSQAPGRGRKRRDALFPVQNFNIEPYHHSQGRIIDRQKMQQLFHQSISQWQNSNTNTNTDRNHNLIKTKPLQHQVQNLYQNQPSQSRLNLNNFSGVQGNLNHEQQQQLFRNYYLRLQQNFGGSSDTPNFNVSGFPKNLGDFQENSEHFSLPHLPMAIAAPPSVSHPHLHLRPHPDLYLNNSHDKHDILKNHTKDAILFLGKTTYKLITEIQRNFFRINHNFSLALKFLESELIQRNPLLRKSIVVDPKGVSCYQVCDPDGPGFGLLGFCTPHYCSCFNGGRNGDSIHENDNNNRDGKSLGQERSCADDLVFDPHPLKLRCSHPADTILCSDP